MWWSTSDIGWVVGHSYIVYAPLMAGATTIAYEGALDHPDADAPWPIIERERRHRRLHLADRRPAADALRRGDPEAARPGPARARRSAPARCSTPPAWEWLQKSRLRGPRAGHRPHVADRDGRADLRQPLRLRAAADQARLGGRRRCPGSRRTSSTRTASPVGVGEKGIMRIKRPFPGLIADALGRARALRRRLLGADPGRLLRRVTPRTSTRTATSGSPAGPTRSSRSPATASGRSRSRPRSCAIPRSPRRASPACPTSCAAR